MFTADTVAGSWDALMERIQSPATRTRWGAAHPIFADLDLLDDADSLCCEARHAESLLAHAVGLASSAGLADDDALLLAVHLLSAPLQAQARTLTDLCPDPLSMLVNELGYQIRSATTARKARGLATSLLWETRRAVLAELSPPKRTRRGRSLAHLVPAGGLLDLDRIAARTTRVGHPAHDDEASDIDCGELLRWSLRRGVDAQGIALLVATETARHQNSCTNPGEVWDAVAAAHGISTRTLYRRRKRTLADLQHAATDYLAVAA
jgi:hypothetical protein